MYYQGTILALRAAISGAFPMARAQFIELLPEQRVPISYLLWMLDEVEKMDTKSIDDALKAARWMGWVFAWIEIWGIWHNKITRDVVRLDRSMGLDKPH